MNAGIKKSHKPSPQEAIICRDRLFCNNAPVDDGPKAKQAEASSDETREVTAELL